MGNMKFQCDPNINGCKTYIVTFFKVIIMTLDWCSFVMKTQFVSSVGGFEITCIVHKAKASAFKFWLTGNV